MSFHRCHAEINVPVDPYLDNVFDGEEGSRGIRFFTHGYDVYTPNKVLVTHDYVSRATLAVAESIALSFGWRYSLSFMIPYHFSKSHSPVHLICIGIHSSTRSMIITTETLLTAWSSKQPCSSYLGREKE